ncbi:ROK family transcriptional regulator [Salibacterium aidingense]|uniref:ROK family transcriptional regulator n=1 Tax=Salibacterium aidingense TaxID=384933 RepID=UPI003BCED9DE
MPYINEKDNDSSRAVNRSMILNLLYDEKLLARNQISEKIGLTAASVTRIVNECIEARLIMEKDSTSTTAGAGRRPVPLSLNNQYYYVVGVHIGMFWIDIGLMNLTGEVITSSRLDRPSASQTSIKIIIQQIKKYQNQINGTILCIGITLYGQVDAEKRIILEHNALGWKNVALANHIEQELHINTIVDTNVYSMAITEYRRRPLPNDHSLLLVNIGTTIGVGIVVNNVVIRGNQGLAGFLEDIPLGHDKDKDWLPNLLTDRSLLNQSQAETDYQFRDIYEFIAFSKDDSTLRNLLSKRAQNVGRVLAQLALIHDPSRIVLAGTCLDEEIPQLQWVQASYKQALSFNDREYVDIEPPENRQNVPFTLIGAGTIAIQEALSPSLLLTKKESANKAEAQLPLFKQ